MSLFTGLSAFPIRHLVAVWLVDDRAKVQALEIALGDVLVAVHRTKIMGSRQDCSNFCQTYRRTRAADIS